MTVDQRPARPDWLAALAWIGLFASTVHAQDLPAVNAADRDHHSHANPRLIRSKSLDLNLKADFDARELSGTVIHEIERAPKTPARTPFILDTRGLTIESAATQADPASPWLEARHQVGPENPVLGQALTITVPADAKRVRVSYKTAPTATALQWLEPAQTAGGKQPFLFSQSEAIQARSWIPLQDSPAVRITYKAAIQAPRGLTALMAADHLERDGNTFHFAMPQAIPPYLIALAIGDLAYEELGPRTGVRAEPLTIKAAAYEFAETEDMVKAVEARFGPYRWGRYELLVLPPSFPFGGMENPKLTFATPTVIAGDRSLVELVAHELAHSWSGNLVSNATWRDFWLNEGFTVYLERRIVEDVYGPERRAMEDVLALQTLRKELAKLPRRDQVLHIDLKERDPDEAMTSVAYEKGARFLMAVEQAFGRERFDAFLKGYFEHFAFQSITTAEFERYLQDKLFATDASAAAKVSLNAWIHSPGLPTIDPEPTSPRLDKAAKAARDWAAEMVQADQIDAKEWVTQEWLQFLRAMPEKLHADRLAELDKAFGFTQRKNAEVLHSWLLLVISADYQPARETLENYLTTIGRRKLVVPLYAALVKTTPGREHARQIYEKARPRYHPLTVEAIDKVVGN